MSLQGHVFCNMHAAIWLYCLQLDMPLHACISLLTCLHAGQQWHAYVHVQVYVYLDQLQVC